MNNRCNHRKKGFSLLELLAVVTILGIIASIIVPRVTVSSDNAKTKVQADQIDTLNAAVERFYIDTGAFPVTVAAMGVTYLPDGVPLPPLDGTKTYILDGNNRVVMSP